MNKLKKGSLALISICLGIIFIFSAWTKVDTLQKFEYSLVEYVHLSWMLAAVGARLLIGMEAGIGFLLILHLYGKNKWVLKFAVFTLIIFSIYLVFLWVNQGNNVNCGCFGDKIAMSPSQSLIKNGFMLVILGLLLKFHRGLQKKILNIIAIAGLCIMIILPLILYGLPDTQPAWLKKDRFQLNMSSLYAPGKVDAPTIDLRHGKYIISFFSLGCPHCRIAAYKLHIMKEKNPQLPFFMVLAGKEENKAGFWKDSKALNIPYTTLEADTFTNLVGWTWPVIYWVNNGWVEAQTNYITLNQDEIEHWLKQP